MGHKKSLTERAGDGFRMKEKGIGFEDSVLLEISVRPVPHDRQPPIGTLDSQLVGSAGFRL
jgi:hypothetical protein